MEEFSEFQSSHTKVQEVLTYKNITFLDRIEKVSLILNRCLTFIAGIAMILLMLVVVANVVSRKIFVPIIGAEEVVGWLTALSIAFALGYTQIHRGHVDIEILVEKFSPRVQHTVHGVMLLISMIFFTLISYKLIMYAQEVRDNETLSETLAVIFYPWIYLLSIGFIGLTIALFVDTIRLLLKGDSK